MRNVADVVKDLNNVDVINIKMELMNIRLLYTQTSAKCIGHNLKAELLDTVL